MKNVHLFGFEAAEAIYLRTMPSVPWQGYGCSFDCDRSGTGWLVYAGPSPQPLCTRIPRSRRAIVIGEPSPMVNWSADYLNQFGILISPYSVDGFNGTWVPSHPGLPWFYGWNRDSNRLLSHQELIAMPMPSKTAELSVVLSNKVVHDGHRTRIRLVEHLQQRLGERISVFGRGIRSIADKAEAIDPFRFHLVLENTQEPNYWSEKLADAYLGYAFPIYAGCPNVHGWFDPHSLATIDPNDPEAAAEKIKQILDTHLDHSRRSAVAQARKRVMTELSFPSCVASALSQFGESHLLLPGAEVIAPMANPRLTTRIRRETKRIYHKVSSPRLKAA